MRLSLCLLATASFASTYGLALPRNNLFNFTNPVTITTFNQSNYRIGVASSETSVHFSPAPIPVVTVENEAPPKVGSEVITSPRRLIRFRGQEHERWAINPSSNGHYTMHVVSFNGAVTNGSVFAVAPLLSETQEFAISTYQDNDTYM